MKKKVLRGALYLRVSTPEQTKGYSLKTQKIDLGKLCKRKGIEICYILRDEGVSGTSYKRRKGLLKLLEHVEDKKIDVVVVSDLSRLARNLKIQFDIMETLMENRVSLLTLDRHMDFLTLNAEGYLNLEIIGAFNEYESRKKSDRSKRGLKMRFEKRLWHGGTVPYGYSYSKETGKLSPIEREVTIIKELYHEYLKEDSTLYYVTLWLNDSDLKPRKAKKFDPKVVSRILRNRLFIGEVKNSHGCYIDPGLQIIPKELFLKVQKKLERLKIMSPNYGGRHTSNGYSTKSICKSCGIKVNDGAYYCHACGKMVKVNI